MATRSITIVDATETATSMLSNGVTNVHLPPLSHDPAMESAAISAAATAVALEAHSAEYLRTIAAELNDVGAQVHTSLFAFKSAAAAAEGGGESSTTFDEDDVAAFDSAMGLYKEAAATMMEAVDAAAAVLQGGGGSDEETAAHARRQATARMEMIVAAKELLLARSSSTPVRTAIATARVSDAMLTDGPESACDAGPIRLAEPITSSMLPRDSGDDDRVGSATLCNIGLLQLRRAGVGVEGCDARDEDSALLDSALRFFRMSLQASEEGDGVCTGGVDRITSLNNLGYGLYRKGMTMEAVEFFKDAVEEIDAAVAEEARQAQSAAAAVAALSLKSPDDSPPRGGGGQGQHKPLKSSFKRGRADCCDALAMGADMMNFLDEPMPPAAASASSAPSIKTASSASSPWCQHARIALLLNASRSLYASGEIESAFDVSAETLELCLQAEEQQVQTTQDDSGGGEHDRRAEIAAVSAALLFNLGRLYEAQGFFDSALQCYRQFVDKCPPESTPEIVAALARILLLECASENRCQDSPPSALGDVAKVLSHLQDAWADLGRDHPSLSAVLRCVGSALSDLGDFTRALPFLLDSLRIKKAAEAQRGAGADTVVALNALGECYHGLTRLADARECYEEVRKIRSERLPAIIAEARECARIAADSDGTMPPPPASATVSSVRFIFAVTLYNGGRIHFELGKREEAARYFGEALHLAKTIVKSSSSSNPNQDPEGARKHLSECAALLHNVGQYETELGRTTAALDCLQSALDIRRRAPGAEEDPHHSLEIAATLYQLGGLRRRVGDGTGAWDCYAESLELERSSSLNDDDQCNPRVAALLYRMAQIRYDGCELDRSLELFRIALAVVSMDGFAEANEAMEERHDEGDGRALSASGVLGWMGTVQGELGLLEEARRSFEASTVASQEEAAAAAASGRPQEQGSAAAAPGISVEAFAEMMEGRPAPAA